MKKTKAYLMTLLKWILTVMLLVLSTVIFAQIISRYFFKYPLVWAEELALLLMVWITFLGSALVLENHDHISIDFLTEKIADTYKPFIRIGGFALILLLNIIFVYGGWNLIQTTKESITPGMNVSVAWLYGGVFIGGILLALISLQHLVKEIITIYQKQVGDLK